MEGELFGIHGKAMGKLRNMKNQSFEALKSFAITNPECKEEKSGSQQSNASNGSKIRVEMKELEPTEADHSKLKANFAGLRNQPSAVKSFRSHFVRLRNSPECFQIFATNVFCYFASDICCLNPNSLLVIHQLDDSLVVKQGYRGSDIEEINNLKKQLSKQFTMKDLGATKFNMNEAKPVSIPLGESFQTKQRTVTEDRRRKGPYEQGQTLHMQWELGYVDADFAGDIDSRKKAEYVAATKVGKEMIWLHGFLDELGKKQEMGILHSDGQSTFFLPKNRLFIQSRSIYKTKYHFIRYLVEDKLVILEKICGSKNPVDMLTKGVTIEKLKLCATSIGLLA
ncbi:Retrovirus-related Pol polyprotein from transposon TNT 1-94 [Vitis vinifera]|uniref:Retrovirus-related Pol polyprotein from transposon TNT 1-94 n=1 Tax=Vitis vinifera TaxID=29760 RepID=A0A438EBZ7_VITVI|nr:Retrovirus-related Pol polyprotein from transposon TNT 1-94 [Vitis vinifera]